MTLHERDWGTANSDLLDRFPHLRAKKKSGFRDYALLVFVIGAWNFVVWQAIENLSK